MNDDRPSAEAATAVANHETEEAIRRAEDEGMPPVIPAGECVDCHHPLERVPVFCRRKRMLSEIHYRPGHRAQSEVREPLFTFYGCTNPFCRKMFWQVPLKPSRSDPRH